MDYPHFYFLALAPDAEANEFFATPFGNYKQNKRLLCSRKNDKAHMTALRKELGFAFKDVVVLKCPVTSSFYSGADTILKDNGVILWDTKPDIITEDTTIQKIEAEFDEPDEEAKYIAGLREIEENAESKEDAEFDKELYNEYYNSQKEEKSKAPKADDSNAFFKQLDQSFDEESNKKPPKSDEDEFLEIMEGY